MPSIVDLHGNPITSATLGEPQTARLAQLRSEWDTHPSRGLTPPRLASILQRAEQGDLTAQHDLFMDMEEKDGHLFSDMQKRRMAVQTLDWSIEPPEGATAAEKDLTAYVKETLCELGDFEDLLFDMTDAVGHGFAALEYQWGMAEGQRVINKATHRPQGWFQLPRTPDADRNELRLRDGSTDGEALWSFGWMLHTHRARSGYISRSGLFRVLAWPFLFKNFAVRDLAEFLEIYGLPLRLGTYGPSATKEDKATLLRAVVDIGHNAAAIVPAGMAIDFKNAATGDNKSFDAMISLMERTMSKAILGGTLTSGEGTHGSQALGNVHNEVRHDLLHADARQLASSITRQLLYPLLAVNKNLQGMRRCPRFVFDTQEPEDVKIYADAVPKLVGMGMRIKRSWAHDKLKIPEAVDGEEVLTIARPEETVPPLERPEPKSTAGAAAAAARIALNRREPTDTVSDALDDLAGDMLDEWVESVGDELQQPLQDALASATSFEDFQAALETGLASMAPAQLAELLARGSVAARMWGRLNRTDAEK